METCTKANSEKESKQLFLKKLADTSREVKDLDFAILLKSSGGEDLSVSSMGLSPIMVAMLLDEVVNNILADVLEDFNTDIYLDTAEDNIMEKAPYLMEYFNVNSQTEVVMILEFLYGKMKQLKEGVKE